MIREVEGLADELEVVLLREGEALLRSHVQHHRAGILLCIAS